MDNKPELPTYSKLIGKILVKAEIKALTPIIIGSGMEENESDIIVVKDWKGRPYIPATSFAGVLRNRLLYTKNKNETQHNYFWGNNCQSAMILDDLMPVTDNGNTPKITVRDGVKIDNKTGIAEDGMKYNYELVEPGAVFSLNMEVNLRAAFCTYFFKNTVAAIRNLIDKGQIYIGAMTNKGMGKISLKTSDIYHLDFSNKKDSLAWLDNRWEKSDYKMSDVDLTNLAEFNPDNKNIFKIDARFSIRSSIIIGAYSGNPEDVDKSHIKSNGKPVLTGTSLKGAIRARAEKIINSIGNLSDDFNSLMGYVRIDDKNKKEIKQESRLKVEEHYIENVSHDKQSRIRVSRFEGGTMSGGLFDSQPVWRKKDKCEKIMVHIELAIHDYNDWEAGLLLYILKDLWTGDLPIGGEKNIGRGILEGVEAIIKYDNKKIKITNGKNNSLEFDPQNGQLCELESFAEDFNSHVTNNSNKAAEVINEHSIS